MVIEFPPEVSPNQTRKFFTNNDTSLAITISFFAFPFPDQAQVILIILQSTYSSFNFNSYELFPSSNYNSVRLNLLLNKTRLVIQTVRLLLTLYNYTSR